jgi:hypothetical protein
MLALVMACGSRTALDVSTPPPRPLDASAGDGGSPTSCAPTSTTVLATITTQKPVDDLVDQIIVDDTWVYVHTTAAIRRVAKCGGPVQVLVDDYWPGVSWPSAAAFTLSSTTITFIANDAITQIAKNGGSPVGQPQLPFANEDHLNTWAAGFWVWSSVAPSSSGPVELSKVDATGKPIAPAAVLDARIAKVLDDGTAAWVATESGLRVIVNGSVTAVSPIALTDLVDDGQFLYGVGGESVGAHTRVVRIEKSTNVVTMLADVGTLTWGVAIDAMDVYFTERDAGAVARVSKSGGTPSVIAASSNAAAIAVAVDDTSLYWTLYDNPNGPAHVMVAPKP